MKYLAPLLVILIAVPAFADDWTATQPSKADEAPATQPKPKARQNDAPPRKAVPLVVKEAKDLWRLLPEDLRPGKDGKVSEELAGKVEAWLKENGKKVDGQVQFVCSRAERIDGTDNHINCVMKDKEGNFLTAPVTDQKEITKFRSVKKSSGENICPEVIGPVNTLKLINVGDTSRLSAELKESKIVSVKLIKRID